MSESEAFRGVVDESVESTELAPGINGFHLAWIHRSTVGVKLISIVCLELGRAAVVRG
jgi:hypothetical protein